jgi:hypothetical protein
MEPSKPNPSSNALRRQVKDILFSLFWHAQCSGSFNILTPAQPQKVSQFAEERETLLQDSIIDRFSQSGS